MTMLSTMETTLETGKANQTYSSPKKESAQAQGSTITIWRSREIYRLYTPLPTA